MNKNINYLSTGRSREVLPHERFQIKWFDFETFSILENWSLRRVGLNRRFNRINNLTHRKFVVLINLSFLYSSGKLEVVHIVDFVESTKAPHKTPLQWVPETTNKQNKTGIKRSLLTWLFVPKYSFSEISVSQRALDSLCWFGDLHNVKNYISRQQIF